jgi:hypothetical protein
MSLFKTKRVFSLALTILLFSVAIAQPVFRPGYIITLQGDTMNGLINYRGSQANAKECIFKKGADSEKVTYAPNQIKSYKFVDGKYYLSSVFMNYKFKELIFLEYVIKGSVNIFYYPDDVKDHYFAVKDTTVIELDHHERLSGKAEEDILIIAKSEKYKKQLKLLIQDQPSLFGTIDRIDCCSKDLIMMTKEYQKLSCPSQECIQYEKKTGLNLKFKFGMLSSAGLSHLSSPPYDVYASDYMETKNLNFKTVFTYEIGTSLNIYLDYAGRNKFCIQLSPTINFVEYKSNEERPLYPLLYVYKLNIKYTTLKIPLLLKYSFYSSNRSIFPYMKLGPGVAKYLSQKGDYEYYSVPLSGSASQSGVYNKSLNHVTKTTCWYFMAGAGTDIKLGHNLISIGAIYAWGEGQLNGFRSDGQLQIEFQF